VDQPRTKYALYGEVPWYRRNGLVSACCFGGFLICAPLLWAGCVIVLTGDVYYKTVDEKGNLKTWGIGNKVAAFVLLFLQIALGVAMSYMRSES